MSVLSRAIRRCNVEVRRAFGARDDGDSLLKDRLVAEPWFIDRVTVADKSVVVEGWSFANASQTHFFINGKPFDRIGYPLPRQDVGNIFWQRRDASMSGFYCTSANVDVAYPGGMMRISRAEDDGRIDAGRDSWYLPDEDVHPVVPDADSRFRVIGDRGANGFLNTGATDFHRLSEAAMRLTGKSVWEFASVLDWGVGCGRLARHFPAHAASALTGCDIDHDNVEWCRANLKGRFVHSTLEPPLPFADKLFDLIYGVSVFTHLRKELQDKWLAELRRVTQIGGIVLVTVHGETAFEFFRTPPDDYLRLKHRIERDGLFVSGANDQLQGHVPCPADYVNVFHHQDYVTRHWGKFFDVLHVIPGYIYTHDLVVLQRTS